MSRVRTSAISRCIIMGVGGGGCNMVDALTASETEKFVCIAADTDVSALSRTKVRKRLRLGRSGLGAGVSASYGKSAAIESERAIRRVLRGCKLLILVVGLGGGTGSGSAPVIAKVARRKGIACVAVVTLPFSFENRACIAQDGLKKLRRYCKATLIIDQDAMMSRLGEDVDFTFFFAEVDEKVRGFIGCVLTRSRSKSR
jgi:cell division protein FtsZ